MVAIYEVSWIDSMATHGWTNEYSKPASITSVGYVIEDNEQGIVLTESINHVPDSRKYGCVTAIPRSAIRKTRVIRK